MREGTKGDRPRVVPIENDVQRDVLERAKLVADGKSGFLCKRGQSYEQRHRRFYKPRVALPQAHHQPGHYACAQSGLDGGWTTDGI